MVKKIRGLEEANRLYRNYLQIMEKLFREVFEIIFFEKLKIAVLCSFDDV